MNTDNPLKEAPPSLLERLIDKITDGVTSIADSVQKRSNVLTPLLLVGVTLGSIYGIYAPYAKHYQKMNNINAQPRLQTYIELGNYSPILSGND